MNKAFYISGIVLSVIFLFVCGYYINAAHDARIAAIFSDYGYDSYASYSYGSSDASGITEEGGLVSLLFFLAFIAIDILGLVKIKTTTMKVMGILGLSISGIFLLWDLMMISSPGALSFDEVGLGFFLYCFIILAFCIVGLVQSIRFANKRNNVNLDAGGQSSDVLDS